MHKNFTEFRRQHVSGSLVATITNIGHQILSLESSSDSVVNTLWFTPVGLQKKNNEEKWYHWISYRYWFQKNLPWVCHNDHFDVWWTSWYVFWWFVGDTSAWSTWLIWNNRMKINLGLYGFNWSYETKTYTIIWLMCHFD